MVQRRQGGERVSQTGQRPPGEGSVAYSRSGAETPGTNHLGKQERKA